MGEIKKLDLLLDDESIISENDQADLRSFEELLDELDSYIGLSDVKKEIKQQLSIRKTNKLKTAIGLKRPEESNFIIFAGNPGTGKTTIASLTGKLFQKAGILTNGHIVYVSPSDFISQYLGQTENKTRRVIDKAIGGVLFIDEAWQLCERHSGPFGGEAINTLLTQMENHRDDLIVIAAGYPEEMKEFLQSDLSSHRLCPTFIEFKDYSEDELLQIIKLRCSQRGYSMTPESENAARRMIQSGLNNSEVPSGNARLAVSILTRAIWKQRNRVSKIADPTKEQLETLQPEDFD